MLTTLLGIKQDKFKATDIYDDLLSTLASQANSGQAVVNVASGTNFAVGECIVIFDPQTNLFETATIQSKNVNALTMTANLTNTYGAGSFVGKYIGYLDTTNRKYKRKTAPDLGTGADGAFVSSGNATWSTEKNFTSVTIQNGHTITVNTDVEIKCQGAFTIQAGGKLSAKGQGHAGGSRGVPYGYDGTSELGAGSQDTGNPTTPNGGGGAGAQCSGFGQNSGAGGGGGGFGTGGTVGSVISGYAGQPGLTYNDASLSNDAVAYRKGAGGGGGCSGIKYNSSYPNAGNGGNGGGIIRISCLSLTVAGEIDCNGNDGEAGRDYNGSYRAGGGGGGAGGSIRILCLGSATIGTGLIHASGGTGGLGCIYGSLSSSGQGGNGGSGRIRLEASSITGTSTPTYATGYLTGYSAYTKLGFYFTQKITTTEPVITVNAYIKQDVVVNELIGASVSAGQKNCQVADGAKYEIGDVVVVKEGSKFEVHTIAGKATNVLTMVDNFANAFTTAGRVFRIDCVGYCSVKPAGANEGQEVMTLKEVFFESSDTIMFLIYSKTVKADNDGLEGVEFVGMVNLKDVALNTRAVAMRECNWEYF